MSNDERIFWVRGSATLIAAALALLMFRWRSRSKTSDKANIKVRRRTSLASLFCADRETMEAVVGMKQNVVNAVLWFEREDVPSRENMMVAMRTLARKFERMRSRAPRIDSRNGSILEEWRPLADIDAAIERAVTEEIFEVASYQNETELEHRILHRVEEIKSQPLPDEDSKGNEMPLWRVVVLQPLAVVVRIDHAIGDGQSLVTLLREISTAENGEPFTLPDLSPLLKIIHEMGDWKISLLPLKLLWPPTLWRAMSMIYYMNTVPEELSNPLRPPPGKSPFDSVETYGTVYFPTMSVSLFKKLARAAGKGTTMNDVLLTCLSMAVYSYFIEVGSPEIEAMRLLLPIANPLPPSLYGDEVEGLCNRMTPVVVPLLLHSSKGDKIGQSQEVDILMHTKSYMKKVKVSNAATFMIQIGKLATYKTMLSSAEKVWRRITCVYSNVPGPTKAVYISQHRIRRIQTIIPHPTSIFQVLSYDGKVFLNIALDTRSAPRAWLLRRTFVEAMRRFAVRWDVISEVRDELDALTTSKEWGGRDVVFTMKP